MMLSEKSDGKMAKYEVQQAKDGFWDKVKMELSNSSLNEGAIESYVLWIDKQFIGYFSSLQSCRAKAEDIYSERFKGESK
jgi:hypothetical protein